LKRYQQIISIEFKDRMNGQMVDISFFQNARMANL